MLLSVSKICVEEKPGMDFPESKLDALSDIIEDATDLAIQHIKENLPKDLSFMVKISVTS